MPVAPLLEPVAWGGGRTATRAHSARSGRKGCLCMEGAHGQRGQRGHHQGGCPVFLIRGERAMCVWQWGGILLPSGEMTQKLWWQTGRTPNSLAI